MLAAKLSVVPLFILAISVASRIWGPFVGGMLSGLPIIAGPITFFLFIEQGYEFAIASANATLIGIGALSSFCFMYSWCAKKFGWMLSLGIAWLGYFTIAYALSYISMPPLLSLLAVMAIVILQIKLAPKDTGQSEKLVITNKEIGLRMFAALLLVLLVTHLAGFLGATFSGIFAAFPVAASVLAVFTHKLSSGDQAAILLKGVMVGLVSLSSFYCGLCLLSTSVGFHMAFLYSLIIVMSLQFFGYKLSWFNLLSKSGSDSVSKPGNA